MDTANIFCICLLYIFDEQIPKLSHIKKQNLWNWRLFIKECCSFKNKSSDTYYNIRVIFNGMFPEKKGKNERQTFRYRFPKIYSDNNFFHRQMLCCLVQIASKMIPSRLIIFAYVSISQSLFSSSGDTKHSLNPKFFSSIYSLCPIGIREKQSTQIQSIFPAIFIAVSNP